VARKAKPGWPYNGWRRKHLRRCENKRENSETEAYLLAWNGSRVWTVELAASATWKANSMKAWKWRVIVKAAKTYSSAACLKNGGDGMAKLPKKIWRTANAGGGVCRREEDGQKATSERQYIWLWRRKHRRKINWKALRQAAWRRKAYEMSA